MFVLICNPSHVLLKHVWGLVLCAHEVEVEVSSSVTCETNQVIIFTCSSSGMRPNVIADLLKGKKVSTGGFVSTCESNKLSDRARFTVWNCRLYFEADASAIVQCRVIRRRRSLEMCPRR